MNNKNFNSISQFSVPQNWINDALSIPSNKNKKKPILFVKFSRTFAAVACLVLVCCVSLLLFFMTNDSVTPPVKPTHSNSISSETTDTDYSEDDSDINIEPTEENFSQNSSSHGTMPSVKPTTKPIVGPTVKPTIEPSEDDTQKPSEDSPIEPSEPNYPVEPSTNPEPPTGEPSYEEPSTEEPSYDEPPWVEPTWEEPSVDPEPPTTEPQPQISQVKVRFPVDLLGDEMKVYCKILDSNGNLVGDPDLYSFEHRASMNILNGSVVIASYNVYYDLIMKSDNYTFVFYTQNNPCIATKTEYLYPIF